MRIHLLILIFILLNTASAHGIIVKINEQDSQARLSFAIEGKKPVVVLRTQIQGSYNVKKIVTVVDNEEIETSFKKKSNGLIVDLPSASGRLEIINSQGDRQSLTISTPKSLRWMKISRSCFQPNFSFLFDKKNGSAGLAGIYCKVSKDKKTLQMYFSTLADSEWLGSDIFEVDGKGQRWKLYELKLNSDENLSSKFEWSSANQKNKLLIRIKARKEEKPPRFFVGLSLLQQNSSNSTLSSSEKGIQASIYSLYPISKSFTADGVVHYMMQNLTSSADGTKNYQARLGARYYFSKSYYVSTGYGILSFTNTELNISTDFEAPYAGAGIEFNIGSRNLDLQANYAQPIAGGATKIGLDISLSPLLFFKASKIIFSYETLNIVTPVEVDSSRMMFNLYYGF